MSQNAPINFWHSIQKNIASQRQKPDIKPVTQNKHLNIPLSYNQEQLWQLEKLHPSSVHNIANALKFTIKLNFAALEASLQEIVRRHAVLRTTFPVVDGSPIQKVTSQSTFHIPILDLSNLAEAEKEIKAKQIAAQEKQKPFNLTIEPGFKVKLIQLAETESILLLTMHHIIFDGVSFGILFRELKLLYEAYSAHKPNPLIELPIQYTDFAYWQRSLLEANSKDSSITYWKDKLQGKLQPLKLPQDSNNKAALNYSGKLVFFQLSSAVTKKLKTLSTEQGVTLFTTLLTAFKILLYCYSKQEDIILVSPIAGRDQPETKDLIGYFNNLLVLRSSLAENPSFVQLLDRVNSTVLKAREHQDLPFKKIAELPNLSRTPLSRGMFAFSNYKTQAPQLSGIVPTSLNISNTSYETSNFDLSLTLHDQGDKLTGNIKYKSALFTDNTIDQMVKNFQFLLETLVANSQLQLSDLPSFSAIKHKSGQSALQLANDTIALKPELQAIENAITQHPKVNQAIVISSQEEELLLAYVLPQAKAELSKDELHQFLQPKLLNSTISLAFLILQTVPVADDGEPDYDVLKSLSVTERETVDLTAINPADWGLSESEKRLFLPQNITQEMVAQIWADVLDLKSFHKGVSKFNVFDNFFELGGHSLAVLRLIERVQEVFQLELALQDLFDCPTIAALADKINAIQKQSLESESQSENWSHLTLIRAGGSKKPLFLIPGGDGDDKTLMYYGQLIFLLGEERPVYGLRTHSYRGGGWLEQVEFPKRVEDIAASYVKEICQLQPSGPYLISGECIGGIVAYEVAQQMVAQGYQVNLLLLDTLCPKGFRKLYSARTASLPESDRYVNKSLALLRREAIDNYLKLVGEYQPQPYPGKITLIISQNRISKPLAMNWQHLALEGATVVEVPGDHDSYMGEFVETTAVQLKACLDSMSSPNGCLRENQSNSLDNSTLLPEVSQDNTSTDMFGVQSNKASIWNFLAEDERIEAVYQQAFDLQPTNAHNYFTLASTQKKRQQFTKAIASYQKGIELDPHHFDAYRNLGNTLCKVGNFNEAIVVFERALKLNSSSPEIYLDLSRYQILQSNSNEALKHCNRALTLMQQNPHVDWRIYKNLALIFRELQSYPEATLTYQAALQHYPEQAELHFILGKFQENQGELEAAISSYQRAIELKFSDAFTIHHKLAHLLSEQKRFGLAISNLKKALELRPNHKEINRRLKIYRAKHNLVKADKFRKAGELKKALKLYEAGLKIDFDNEVAWRQLAQLHQVRKEYAKVIHCCRKAIQINPQQSFGLYKNLGQALLKRNNLTEATVFLNKALELRQDHPHVYHLLGSALQRQGKLEEAINQYQKAVELEPNNADLHSSLKDVTQRGSRK